MPRTCAVISCMKTTADAVSIHQVPSGEIGKKWLEFILNANEGYDWIETKAVYLCSLHFDHETDVSSTSCRPRILPTSVPTILNGSKILPASLKPPQVIKPFPSIESGQLSYTKSIPVAAAISHDLVNFTYQPVMISMNQVCNCKELIQKKDEEILRLTKALADCRGELKNWKRKCERSQEAKRKLKEDSAAPPKKIIKLNDSQSLKHSTDQIQAFKELLQYFLDRLNHPNSPYPDKIKELAFNLHYFSNRTYVYLRDAFLKTLPHPRNFNRWTSHINVEPGFLKDSLSYLATKIQSSPQPLYFSLSFDEVHIRKQIIYKDGKFLGFLNYGGISNETESDKEASAALFVMATEVNGNFKIPIAYILTKGLPTVLMVDVIQASLKQMHSVGGQVLTLTFDGLSSNLSACKTLGAKLDPFKDDFSPFIPHPITKEPVYIFPDPSHMLKLLRNILKTDDLIDSKGNKIQWSFINQLYELQVASGLRAANKLTSRHVSFENQKMKTRLCTQTLSNSVSVALAFCRKLQIKGFEGSEPTEEFLKCLDRLNSIPN